ncbi:virulence RhuM family protein [Pseudomonas syringae]|uniref:RhuM family protein n=1 Tax=Pseudomonas sp. Irchel 3A5 TaxID=2008911 RepID=UPI000BA2D93E|nr:RhuM family protein [Pseudomonas sp. Irchel 3A5]MCQ2999757.1 virulence RhuM family protein [Pseudomonas syringae]
MSNGKDGSDPYDNSVMFVDEGVEVSLRFESEDQAIWATGQNIAELFGIDYSNAKKHIKNVYADQELLESATMAKFAIVQIEGGREVVRPETAHYNLDMIISVGYRVNAKRAVRFRQWATQTLKTYIEQGYVINEKALRESPEKLNKLAAAVRALRSEEKQVYAKVRECFRICASDYDPGSKEVRSFYALLQDKFHHAVTGMTSSKLILDRANHHSDNMGMQAVKGASPTIEEAKTGKNYLNNEELYRLHLLSEQFMLYAESTALTKRPMTMSSLHGKLDALLIFNDYPVFSGYEDYIKEEALSHARQELGLYKKRLKIESLGYKYDEDALAAGEYDELLIDA